MVTIDITLLTGRYHATPWGRGVNEGAVEWPPAPWRLIRGLLATWHRRGRVEPEAIVRATMQALSAEAPCFDLPPAVISHTRHYLPVYTLNSDTGRGKTSKVIDAFVHAGGASPGGAEAVMRVCWPNVDLSAAQVDVLGALVAGLSYLGRAETWIDARLQPATPPDLVGDAFNVAAPVAPGAAAAGTSGEIVEVLCPRPVDAFMDWRAQTLDAALIAARASADDVKAQRTAERRAAKAMNKVLPTDAFAALHTETSDLQKQGWSLPPGARWVAYERPRDCLAGHAVRRRPVMSPQRPTTARFVLSSAVPPRITEAIRLCERVHAELVRNSRQAPVFTGYTSDGARLVGHQHAFILPEARDLGQNAPPGAIDGLVIHAAMGFDDDAQQALQRLGTMGRRSGHDWHLALEALGSLDSVAARGYGDAGAAALHRGTVWRSVTPFVPTRSVKRRRNGKPRVNADGLVLGSAEHDLRRLLALAELPAVVAITPLDDTRLGGSRSDDRRPGGKRASWLSFTTARPRHKADHGSRGAARGYGYEVQFAAEVRGPLALGFGAHLGLGLFEPVA